jgi:branched-chain amino acid transport system ATP-binding protein
MALAASNVSIRFGGILAVNHMSIHVADGQIVGLIGPNGAGKTTFINCISGTYRPQEGSILWKGAELAGHAPYEIIKRGVVRTFQNVASIHGLTVLDMVKLGASMRDRSQGIGSVFRAVRRDGPRDEDLVETILKPLRLADAARQPLETLSYGLRKAVDLARALAARPDLLLLDEPVAGLTAQEGAAMADVIKGVRDRIGCAVLMVEHKMDVVNAVSDHIVVMAAGSKIFEGSAGEVQSDREVRRVYLGEP